MATLDSVKQEWTDFRRKKPGDVALPMHLKCRAVWARTELTKEAFVEDIRVRHRSHFGVTDALKDFTRSAMNEVTGEQPPADGRPASKPGQRMMVAHVNLAIRARLGMAPMTLADFKDTVFSGDSAVTDFLNWLRRLPDQVHLLPAPASPSHFSMRDHFKDQLSACLKFFREPAATSRLMVVNSDREAGGQFARELVALYRDVSTSRLPICYFPVGRPSAGLEPQVFDLLSPADAAQLRANAKPQVTGRTDGDPDAARRGRPRAAPHTLPLDANAADGVRAGVASAAARLNDAQADQPVASASEGRREASGGPRSRMSTPVLATLLRAFLLMQSAHDPGNRVPRTAVELTDAILAVRRALAKHPCILVFDGYSAMGESLSALRSMLVGDPLSTVLPHLMEEWGGAPDFDDPCRFTGNDNCQLNSARILVIADRDTPEFAIYNPVTLPNGSNLRTIPNSIAGELFHSATRDQIRGSRTPSTAASFAQLTEVAADRLQHANGEQEWTLIETQWRLQQPAPMLAELESDIGAGLPKHARFLSGDPTITVTNFLDGLKGRPLALLILRFVALSPNGLRLVTLWHLLKQWCEARDGLTGIEAVPRLSRLREYARRLQPLLVEVVDDPVEGLDDVSHEWTYLDAGDYTKVERSTALRLLDIRTRNLRELIVGHLARGAEPVKIAARMHRLLAEEALRQNTVSSRHRRSNEPLQIAALQRTCQLLFHGFSSLQAGPLHVDDSLRPVARTLPGDPRKIYIRLYSIFYRQLLEAPPHWELARVHGYETLKSDLLSVAICVEQAPRFYSRSGGLKIDPLDFLEESARRGLGKDSAIASFVVDRDQAWRIQMEQLLHLARAFYFQGKLKKAKLAHTLARGRLGDGAGTTWEKTAGADDWNIVKIITALLDLLGVEIDRLQNPSSLESVFAAMAIVGLSEDIVTKHVGDILLATHRAADRQSVGSALKEACGASAEALGPQASPMRLYMQASVLEAYGDLLFTRPEPKRAVKTLSQKMDAFVIFHLAEHVRRRAFDLAPFDPNYRPADGHHMRSFVRLCRELAEGIPAEATQYPTKRFFMREARRQADMAARYYARYPAERPSLHMLEAIFPPLNDDADFAIAFGCFESAERWMISAQDRPRIRMRMLHERRLLLNRYEKLLVSRRATLQSDLEKLPHRNKAQRDERNAKQADIEALDRRIDVLRREAARDLRRLAGYARIVKDAYWEWVAAAADPQSPAA